MENLGRGVVAVRTSDTDVYLSWRMLGTDPDAVAFNVYRSTSGGAAVLLNASPLTGATIFTDSSADLTQPNAYTVRSVLSGVEQPASAAFTLPANAPVQGYLRLPLQRPAGGTTPDGVNYTYSPNDCSVGDLDGDGEYEIVVKWDPSNSQDNSNSGYTGNVFLDAYKLDGTLLWRIDLGRNIRAGAHYTQYLVFDFDGDGKAELVCKTAEGTKDGTGAYIGSHFAGTPPTIDNNADHRSSAGYILEGPEFFTVFKGDTGAELMTANYDVPRGNVGNWGDTYGNRVDRFLACVAYLDGQRPSFVLCRGYYTRAYLAAWDWRDGQLTKRWTADTGDTGAATPLAAWRGQGSHAITVGDVDGDGRDEITYGAAAFDDDGTGLYSTTLGHGDALHMSKMDPNRPGLQVWMAHEDPASYGANGLDFRDAKTGAVIFGVSGNNSDVGRGCAGDIDPSHLGYELWGARGGLMSVDGTQISSARPSQMNFMIWWDGDLLRELLDGTTISKWDPATSKSVAILSPSGVSSNNSTKATPCLSADLFGDWREEVIWRENTNDALRIYTSTIPTTYRLRTLMHDRQYREAIAWQNVGYNQPPHPGFYLGEGMTAPAAPDMVTGLASLPPLSPAVVSVNRYDPTAASTGATSVVFRVSFNVPVTGVNAADFTVSTTGSLAGTVTNVTALSAFEYNVTVGAITGTGTIRLDLNAAGTGITGPGGVPIAGGFIAGSLYQRATLAWLNVPSGSLWSNSANWDGGVIADATGAVPIFGNFDVPVDTTVALDGPRTIGGATFGDADPATPASWTVDDGGVADNTLMLDIASGSPTLAVNALGTGSAVTMNAAMAGTKGFAKQGLGTLVLGRSNPIIGALTVNNGTISVATGGVLAMGNTAANLSPSTSTDSSAGSKLIVAGGSYSAGGLVTLGSGTGSSGRFGVFQIDSGTASLDGGIRINNESGSIIRVNGGTFSATDVNVRRNSAGTVDYRSGFIVAGGDATVGTVWLGNNNSNGAMSVEGGTVTVTGALTIGNNGSNSSRGGGLRVIGGQFTSTDVTSGIILTRANANTTSVTLSGGVSTVEKFTFGGSSSVTSGSGTLTLGGGTLYLGSGGLVKNGAGTYAAKINLGTGTLGAKADWSTSLPISLTGDLTIQAANATSDAFAISLNGPLSGSGGITKTGGGVLSLGGAVDHTYSGATTVNAGALRIAGSLAAATNGVTINAGGALTGDGVLSRDVTLNDGGAIAPDGAAPIATLTGASLTWNGGGTLAMDLGTAPSADQVALSGALTKGTAGTYALVLNATAPIAAGDLFTLASFASTTFVLPDFQVTGLPAGFGGRVILTPTNLSVLIIARPVINSPGTAAGTYGTPFSYQISALNGPTSFGAANLPPGVNVDAATGLISGTPTAAGTYNVTISASNEGGTNTELVVMSIAKAVAQVSVGVPGNSTIRHTYDGTPQPAAITTVPADLSATFTYNGSATVPTLPGTYDVAATIADPNYQGTANGKLVITITALVRHAPTVNGDLDGSFQMLTGENVTLNGNAIISGDLLVPGTPAVHFNGQPTVVDVHDATGSTAPADYAVTFNGTAMARYLVRRVDPIAMPVVTAPAAPAGTRSIVLNRSTDSIGDPATVGNLTLNGAAGLVALPPGAYGNLTANGGTGFILGVADATEPAVYDVQQLTLNGNATVQVVGPVVLRLARGVALNGTVGNVADPRLLTIELATGGVTLNGGARLYGLVVAPQGAVTLNGSSALTGEVTADRLVINGNSALIEAP